MDSLKVTCQHFDRLVQGLVICACVDEQRKAFGLLFVVQDDARPMRIVDKRVLQRDPEQLMHVDRDQHDLSKGHAQHVLLIVSLQVTLLELVKFLNKLETLV